MSLKSRALLAAAALALPAAAIATSAGTLGLVRWRSTAQGAAESGSSGRPILYFFTADWCGPCHLMKDQVFGDKDLAALIEREYVPVEVVDRTRESGRNSADIDKLLQTYDVHGFPTLVVTRPKSKSAVYVEGWPGKDRVAKFLKTVKDQLRDMEKEKAKTK
jgi:thiol:disulfide interchange protein